MLDWLLDWLQTPLSGASMHHVEPWLAWHGRAMVLAWAVCVPLGALGARFFKVTRRQDWPRELDNPAWWHAHRLLQGAAVAAMAAGAVLAWGRPDGGAGAAAGAAAAGAYPGIGAVGSSLWGSLHGALGLALLVAAALQLGGGLARGTKGGPTEPVLRGDHFDMTPRRVRFERVHKAVGWLAVAGSVPCIVLGLVVADAPRWMLLALALWWGVLAACFVQWQRSGRCVGTYQAIWGPDPTLPGNRRTTGAPQARP